MAGNYSQNLRTMSLQLPRADALDGFELLKRGRAALGDASERCIVEHAESW